MPRRKKISSVKLSWVGRHPRRFVVLSLFALSLGVNVFMISYYYYITRVSPLTLVDLSETHNCAPTQYTKWMQSINTSGNNYNGKKFAAAAVCFTDYQTGRPLDINSLKANMSKPVQLPAHP